MCNLRASRDGSFTVFFFCFLASIVAYSTPFWYSGRATNEGIWQSCTEMQAGDKQCRVIFGENSAPLIKGVQAMMTVTVGFFLITFGLYCAWLCQKPHVLEENGLTFHGKAALTFMVLGGVASCCGVIAYGSDFVGVPGVQFDWSFYLAAASGALATINGMITLCVISRPDVKNPLYGTTYE